MYATFNFYIHDERHSVQQLQLHQYSKVGDDVGVFLARFLATRPLRFRDAPTPVALTPFRADANA